MTIPEIKRLPLAAFPVAASIERAEAFPAAETLPRSTPLAPAAVSGVEVELVTDLAAIDALRDEWDELLAASAADEIFLTWEWLATWWRHLGAGRLPALFTVRDRGRLIALAPLAGPAPGSRPGLARLRFLGSGAVGSDYLDVVVRRGEEETALAALAERLDRERSILDLVQVRSGRSAVGALASVLERRGWTRFERTTHLCPCVELRGRTWDEFVATLGSSHRANLRRRLRQVERAAGFTFRRAITPGEVEAAFDSLVKLHRLCWSDRGGSDALADPAIVEFHRDFCRLALARDWLRLYVLEIEGRPAAALYGMRYGNRFLFYQSGFDPERAGISVGLVCLALSMREAIAEGAEEYDLLHGAEPYKFLWARRCRSLSRFELFPPAPGAGLRNWLRRGVWMCKDGLRRGLGSAVGRPAAPGWQPLRAEVES